MSSWGWGYFPRYQTVAERRRKAKKRYDELIKKGVSLDPVTVQGRLVAKSWWGGHWNRNLQRYADFHNRLGRGRSYVRNGAVLDLKISGGRLRALVAGSGRKPYQIEINIRPLKPEVQQKLIEQASGQIGTVSRLLEGDFPRELGDLFFAETGGLFPTPGDVRFSCSCPDWASLCKHIAAVLYGTGARLDERPALFFTLRGMDMEALLGAVAGQTTGRLLSKAKEAARVSGQRSRILHIEETAGRDLSGIFGISVSGLETGSGAAPIPEAEEKAPQILQPAGRVRGRTSERKGVKKRKRGK